MSDSNMVFISHLSGLYACWKAEGTRGIRGRLPKSAEHYKFQAFPHSPSQLIHLLLASFFLCTRYYCKIFSLERFKGKRCYALFFMVLFFLLCLNIIKELCKWSAKEILSANLPLFPTAPPNYPRYLCHSNVILLLTQFQTCTLTSLWETVPGSLLPS